MKRLPGSATVRIWDVAERKSLAVLRGHPLRVNSVVFAFDGNTLVAGGDDMSIKLWQVSTAQFSADRRLLASAGGDPHSGGKGP